MSRGSFIRRAFIVLLLILLGFLLAKRDTVLRLSAANNLFNESKIVYNFTHMNELFFTESLTKGSESHSWPEAIKPLPEIIQIDGQNYNLNDYLEQTKTTALLVVKDGTIVAEDYYLGTDREDQRISWSVAKSFLSAMMGIAAEEGKIKSIDDPVTDYVPELKDTAYGEASIRNVLNMASGVEFNEDYFDRLSDISIMGSLVAIGGSLDKYTMSLKESARAPGTHFQYVSMDTHVLGMVLRAATGERVQDYFMRNLWHPLGPGKDAYYITDRNGVAFVLGGLNMRTRDYALLGQLFLQNGQWKGRQLISESWVKASTRASAPPPPADAEEVDVVDYGFQWWVPEDSHGDYMAIGIYDQFIYVDPKAKTVIVKNSAHREFQESGPSGRTYLLDNIDMFRSLTEYYN